MIGKEIKRVVIYGWDLLRKPTTPVHLVYGLFCVFLIWQFGILVGLVMMAAFFKWEKWNDHNEKMRVEAIGLSYVYQGDSDWWESGVSFCLGFFVLGILQALGIVSIGWL